MTPIHIASLTVVILIGLILEYFTRWFSRGLHQALRLATPATPGETADAGVSRQIEFRTLEREVEREDDARSSYTPPSFEAAYSPSVASPTLASSPRDHASARATRPAAASALRIVTAEVKVAGRGESIPTQDPAELRASTAIQSIVCELIAVENELTRDLRLGGNVLPLERLKTLAVYYDLDDLMQISENALNKRVIAFYREVARFVLDLEDVLRDVTILGSLDDATRLLAQARQTRLTQVADAIVCGMRLTERLSQRSDGAAPKSRGPGAGRALTARS